VKRLANGSVRLEWQHYFTGICEARRASRPDFSDAVVIASNTLGYCIDTATGGPWYYRVDYAGDLGRADPDEKREPGGGHRPGP